MGRYTNVGTIYLYLFLYSSFLVHLVEQFFHVNLEISKDKPSVSASWLVLVTRILFF